MANWIKNAIKSPGSLHRSLGVPEGQKIPASKLAKAAKSSDPTTRKRVALARTLSKFKKGKGGPGGEDGNYGPTKGGKSYTDLEVNTDNQ